MAKLAPALLCCALLALELARPALGATQFVAAPPCCAGCADTKYLPAPCCCLSVPPTTATRFWTISVSTTSVVLTTTTVTNAPLRRRRAAAADGGPEAVEVAAAPARGLPRSLAPEPEPGMPQAISVPPRAGSGSWFGRRATDICSLCPGGASVSTSLAGLQSGSDPVEFCCTRRTVTSFRATVLTRTFTTTRVVTKVVSATATGTTTATRTSTTRTTSNTRTSTSRTATNTRSRTQTASTSATVTPQTSTTRPPAPPKVDPGAPGASTTAGTETTGVAATEQRATKETPPATDAQTTTEAVTTTETATATLPGGDLLTPFPTLTGEPPVEACAFGPDGGSLCEGCCGFGVTDILDIQLRCFGFAQQNERACGARGGRCRSCGAGEACVQGLCRAV